MIKVIADAGGTSTTWVVVDYDGNVVAGKRGEGINAVIHDSNYLKHAMEPLAEMVESYGIPNEVFFYGAGCISEEVNSKIVEAISNVCKCPQIEVNSDLLGAARGTCGLDGGVACILGTGSNSCLYNGWQVIENIRPLGFILGDEGSGAALGKRLVNSVLKGLLPSDVHEAFFDEYKLSYDEIIKNVYRGASPSGFLASFAPFIKKHIDNESISKLVEEEFSQFIERNLLQYPGIVLMSINFVGGIAVAFEQQLRSALSKYNLSAGYIVPDPLPGLIEYHNHEF